MGEVWGFLWVMLALKIPLAMLLYIVWYAVRATPEPIPADDDGGIGDRAGGPNAPRLGPRRRGPHGDGLVPPPPRTRTAAASRDAARPGAQR